MTPIRLLLFLLVMASCSPGSGGNPKILPPEKMQLVLWDIIEADVYISGVAKKDSSINPHRENALMQAAVFEKHNITRNEYYTSLDHYVANSAEFIPMLDSIMVHHPSIRPLDDRRLRLKRDSLKVTIQQ